MAVVGTVLFLNVPTLMIEDYPPTLQLDCFHLTKLVDFFECDKFNNNLKDRRPQSNPRLFPGSIPYPPQLYFPEYKHKTFV